MRAQVGLRWLPFLKSKYADTKNPVYVWEAIGDCLTANATFPGWVLEYLGSVSLNLHAASRDAIPRRDSIDRAVAKAMGFTRKGRINLFREPTRLAHELLIALDVYERHTAIWAQRGARTWESRPRKWQSLFEDVVETHAQCDTCRGKLSWKTVEKYWRQHAFQVIPPHLVKRSKSRKIDDILR